MFNSSHEMRLKTPSRHHVWEILISKAQPIVNKEGFSQISRNSLLTAPSYLPILAICLNLLDLLKTFAFKKLIKYVALLLRGDWGKLEKGGGECYFSLDCSRDVSQFTGCLFLLSWLATWNNPPLTIEFF